MLGRALSYFRRGETGERAFLVGAITSFSLAILLEFGRFVTTLLAVVPAVALASYFARVLVASADGASAPPRFPLSARVFRDGLLATLVAGIYLLVPAVVLLVTVLGALGIEVTAPLAFSTSTRIYAGSAVALFVALGFTYLTPAAVVLAVRQESLRAGFGLADIRSLVAHGAYFYAWTMALALLALGAFVAAALAGVPLVGPALAVFAGFYVVATATHLVGLGCARAS